MDALTVTNATEDLIHVTRTSEARVFLLYGTKDEAIEILKAAKYYGLTEKSFVWIVTQSVIGAYLGEAPDGFPIGMLGVHFPTDSRAMISQIRHAMFVVGHALEAINQDESLDANKRVLLKFRP